MEIDHQIDGLVDNIAEPLRLAQASINQESTDAHDVYDKIDNETQEATWIIFGIVVLLSIGFTIFLIVNAV